MIPIGDQRAQMPVTREQRFTSFCTTVEPRLRRALVAAYGTDLGTDATADALAWAWEHFERVERMRNAPGYLWRVGQTSARRSVRRSSSWALHDGSLPGTQMDLEFEPGLIDALADLSARQRTAVMLVHGHGYSLTEAASQMGCRPRTLRHHLDRGLSKLRRHLGVGND